MEEFEQKKISLSPEEKTKLSEILDIVDELADKASELYRQRINHDAVDDPKEFTKAMMNGTLIHEPLSGEIGELRELRHKINQELEAIDPDTYLLDKLLTTLKDTMFTEGYPKYWKIDVKPKLNNLLN